ncbi:hypothetical protein DL93DRAFT_1253131 [Clavulina sp. PMI_390]|nr:hypothetical protein DL93DRAFT_1253131 [Clavulina sp. PMI_390]
MSAPLYFHGRPVQHFDSANLRCTLYILAPYSYVYHIGGALHQRVDAVFAAYQQDEVRDLFQRRTLKQSIVRGQRNRHFSFNSGVPYKYCSENDTLPIETGPRCVQLARELVTATTEAVLHYDPGFNEVLSVMYMEDMAMNWHTDNEVGLGDVVASLSLGAACRMRFRGRKSLRKDTPAIGDLPKLTLDLTHGDIVIMQGYVQEYYEHCIENLGGFRIAATCRYIDARIHH